LFKFYTSDILLIFPELYIYENACNDSVIKKKKKKKKKKHFPKNIKKKKKKKKK